MECYSCEETQGKRRLSPGPTIFQGEFWRVEHAYPCGMKGWLVIILNRHAEALHELTAAEFTELASIQHRAATALQRHLDCPKEYTMCFAEAPHFNHVHFHVVARLKDAPENLKGPAVFALIRPDVQAIPANETAEFCEELRRDF